VEGDKVRDRPGISGRVPPDVAEEREEGIDTPREEGPGGPAAPLAGHRAGKRLDEVERLALEEAPAAISAAVVGRRLHAMVGHVAVSRVYSRHGGIPMTQLSQVLHSDPGILGGTPVFVGTRVPVQSLFDYLEGGETLDEFLRQFPSVKREQAIAALDLARDSLLAGARSS
jgi:uncharacterized protein (DUF433 family)